MQLPDRFSDLPEYVFPRLRALLDGIPPGGPVLPMSIGSPMHPFPEWVGDAIRDAMGEFGGYPANDGTPELLAAISAWIGRRHGADVAPERIMAANGTREALYNAVVALCPERKDGARPVVLIPNPFYQVYAAGTLAVGAEPVYVPATAETGFLPDFASVPEDVLQRTAILFICSPSNPQGAVASKAYYKGLLDLAERYDFRVFSDECYSEIYRDTPPPGLLGVAAEVGADPERAVAFNSLSKRSSMAGLRSGFVAAGPEAMKALRRLRAYAGAPPSGPLQRVAERLWADEDHVEDNRARYRRKFDMAGRILGDVPGFALPEGGFFLWLPVEDGEAATRKLWAETGVKALPGSYLARDQDGGNPGHGYVRAALVSPDETEMERGLTAIRDCLYGQE